jgi:hypothetical protein
LETYSLIVETTTMGSHSINTNKISISTSVKLERIGCMSYHDCSSAYFMKIAILLAIQLVII